MFFSQTVRFRYIIKKYNHLIYLFRCISYTVRSDVGIWWIAFVLHGIGTRTVPSMWMSHSVEENLPGSKRYGI